MAKKTKRGKVSGKKSMKAKKIQQKPTPLTAVHILGIVGGIITLLAGVWFLGNLHGLWHFEPLWTSFGDLGIVNIICGIILIVAAASLKKNFLRAGLVLLIFSIIALFVPPMGLVVGPVLAIIGAIIAFVKAAQPTKK
ncbi:MAG: hypothetical protein QXP53_01055 [Candidatus Pacearchaeota archaeon]